MDKLMGEFIWYWGSKILSISALNFVIQSGKLHLIRNPELRQLLAGWPEDFEELRLFEMQDRSVWDREFLPYLRKHSYLAQLSSASDHFPGSDQPIPSLSVPTNSQLENHRELLKNREFQNLVFIRWWVQYDILLGYDSVETRLDTAISLIEDQIQL